MFSAQFPSNQISATKDSLILVQSIKGFLHWYKENYKKSSAFRLVGIDKNGNYFVNKKVCEKYLKHLKSSGYISDIYIERWKIYFLEKDANFKTNPQNEGPPEGFDYDLVTSTQEPDLLYNGVETLKFRVKEFTETTATVEVVGEWTFDFTMSKVGGRWKIDGIEIQD